MLGLMLKDIMNLKKTFRIYILFIVFYALLSFAGSAASSFMGVMIILITLLPISAISYDERAKWDRYALTMPVSRHMMVLSKYLLGILLLIPGILAGLLFGVIADMDIYENLVVCASLALTSLFMLSILLPVIYRFGVERGRIIMIAVFLLPAVLIVLLSQVDLSFLQFDQILRFWFLFPVVILALLVLSFLTSVRIYEKKDFS